MLILEVDVEHYGAPWSERERKQTQKSHSRKLTIQDKANSSDYRCYSITLSTLSILESVYLPDVA
jgi:hypothetical protein